MSLVQPLTEKALYQHILLLAQEDGAGDALTLLSVGSNDAMQEPAHPHLQMPKEKLDHIFKYIDCQLSYTQESLPKPDNSSNGIGSSRAPPQHQQTPSKEAMDDGAHDEGDRDDMDEAGPVPTRRRKTKRKSLKRSLRAPSVRQPTLQSGMPAALELHGKETSAHLRTINAMPASASGGCQKQLGIFNKGKAVASGGGTGIAFSETDLLRQAHSIGAQANAKIGKQEPVAIKASISDSGSSQEDTAHDGQPIYAHSPAAYSYVGLNIHGTAESAGKGNLDADIFKYDYPSSPPGPLIPKSWPQARQSQQDYQRQESLPNISDTYKTPSSPVAVQDEAQFAEQQALDTPCALPDPSNERADDDSEQMEELQPAGDTACMLDERDERISNMFPVLEMSLGNLSAFGSNFFASQDIHFFRNAGEITVSDFGNSLYRTGYQSGNMRHSGDVSRDNSIDTLPEYVPRSELPPPYAFNSRPRLCMPDRSHCPMRQMNRSRAHIPLSPCFERPASRTFSADSNADGALLSDNDMHVDFRFYPRRLS
ncbi:hypothetical protein GGI12_002413 [Dipsacomyces acuminosporus]|nr:hypothetical protein GGI12_002413 [Dipsacomyces acuminosporus]